MRNPVVTVHRFTGGVGPVAASAAVLATLVVTVVTPVNGIEPRATPIVHALAHTP